MTTTSKSTKGNVLQTNPKPIIISGLLVIFVFFGGLAAWSAFLPFAGAVIAPGVVEVSQERKTVQHLEGGIVEKILVREGDVVAAGQPLIKLKRTEIDAAVSLMQSQIWAKTAKAARLRAENRMAASFQWPESLLENREQPEVLDAMQMEKEIFDSRRTALTGTISLIESQISQLYEKVEGAKEELNAQQEIISTLKEEIDAKQALFDENYIDKAQILELKRRLAERKGRAGSLKQVVAETREKIEELRLRIINLRDTYKEEAIAELGKTQDILFELKDKLRPQLDALNRLTITAPVSGEVLNMRIHSETSGVIKPGEPILDIVPEAAKLIVEARLRPDKITDVHKGQKTRVQLSAFNRRTTPPVIGSVIYVAPDQVSRQTARGEESYYIVRVQVEEAELKKNKAYLSPGMPAVCYIETEERTILGYLLEPILEVTDQALRES